MDVEGRFAGTDIHYHQRHQTLLLIVFPRCYLSLGQKGAVMEFPCTKPDGLGEN